MPRALTIRNQLSKKQLYDIVISSIRDSDWNITNMSGYGSFPLKVTLSDGENTQELLIYIWNISQGGKTRNPEEYRIQMKGSGLVINHSFKTLLLGWFDEEKVFAAFDAYKHRVFGSSPSVQVPRATLHQSIEHGLAFHTKKIKDGQEIVVAFRPEYFMEYVQDVYPQYHESIQHSLSEAELKVVEQPLDMKLPDSILDTMPTERKTVVQTLNRKVRDARFKRNIFFLYKGRCAICGLQARLTESAHIIPVKEEGTDELTNGILLCRNHHKAYDSGLLAISPRYIIVLNHRQVKRLSDGAQDNKLKEFISESRIGETIFLPDDTRFHPKKEFLLKNCESKGI